MGYGKDAQDFVKRFKSLTYYKISDSDSLGARVHTVHVLNNKDSKYKELGHRYQTKDNNFMCVLKDGDEETSREIPFGSSHDWLLTTDGHRTVVEFSDGDPDKYLEILKGQIKKDFDIHVTTPEIASHREELEELASNVGAKIYFYSGDTVVDALMEYLDVEYSKGKGQRLSDETGACGLDDKVDWSKY